MEPVTQLALPEPLAELLEPDPPSEPQMWQIVASDQFVGVCSRDAEQLSRLLD